MRLLQNLETRETKVFSLDNIFDPRENTLYRLVKQKDVLEYLKVLYSKENLRAYPKVFFTYLWDHYGTDEEAVKTAEKIITLLPDGQEYLLSMGNIVPHRHGIEVNAQYANPDQSHWTDTGYSRYLQQHYGSSDHQIDTPPGKDFVQAQIVKLKEYSDKEIAKFGNLQLAGAQLPLLNGSSHLLLYLLFFATNKKFILDQSGRTTFDPSQIKTLLGVSSGTRVRVSWRTNIPWCTKVQLFQPVTSEDRTGIETMLNYSANPLDILDWPIVEKGEHDPVLYGVEFETSTDYTVRELVHTPEKPFFICKHDSSVRGAKPNCYEMVTIPMSLKAHKLNWADLISKLDYGSFDCTNETTNGMHVHISKARFSDDKNHLKNFTWFFINPNNKPFLMFLSERDEQSWNQYSPTPRLPSAETKFKSYERAIRHSATVRGAINTGQVHNTTGTIEVRLFKGIMSFGSIMKNLEFVDSVYNFCMGKSNPGQLTLMRYQEYLESLPRNKYATLRKFMSFEDVQELIRETDFAEQFLPASDPFTFIAKVRKSGIRLLDTQIKYVNRVSKFKIGYDQETNELEVIKHNLGKLSKFDRAIESKYARKPVTKLVPTHAIEPIEDEDDYDNDDDVYAETIEVDDWNIPA